MSDLLQLSPARIDYTIYQGTTFWRKTQVNLDGAPFPFKDDAGDLAWSARMQIRVLKTASTTLADIGTPNYKPDAMSGILIFQEDVEGAESSWLEFLLSASVTGAFPITGSHTYYYDVIITHLTTGQVIRLQEGQVTVSIAVTRKE